MRSLPTVPETNPKFQSLLAKSARSAFHCARAAAPLARLPPPAEILAGRDLRSQGTWLGIDRRRRFGVVTNYRELQPPLPAAPSRGDLIPAYLGAAGGQPPVSAAQFFAALEGRASGYSGFNLLLTDSDSLWYGSNRSTPFSRSLPPGVYGLANEALDTPWPKLERVRAGSRRAAYALPAVALVWANAHISYWIGIALTRQGKVTWNAALKLGLLVAVLFALMEFNQWDLLRAGYDTHDSYSSFVIQRFVLILLGALGTIVWRLVHG